MKGNKAKRIEKQRLLDEASALEWQRQVAELRRILVKFTEEEDPQQVRYAQRGMHRLAIALVDGQDLLRPDQEIDWSAFKAALVTTARQTIPETKPESFKVHPDENSKSRMHIEGERPWEGAIQPQTICMLFDRHGLVGEPMNLAQLGQKYGYASPESARRIVAQRALRPLQRNKDLLRFISRPIRQNS